VIPEVGMAIPSRTMGEITMERVHALMELMHDTNPVHDDPELVEKRKLRGPVNQGPANLSYVVDMLVAWGGPNLQLERFEFRFQDIVVPGDVVVASGTVTGTEPAGDHLRVWCEWSLDVEGGSTAVAGTARVLIPGADGARAG
jgi:acyl dehydratase